MTKKDYELIASQLYQACYIADMSDNRKILNPFVEAICKDFADALKPTNPLFNRQRFLEACGIEK